MLFSSVPSKIIFPVAIIVPVKLTLPFIITSPFAITNPFLSPLISTFVFFIIKISLPSEFCLSISTNFSIFI